MAPVSREGRELELVNGEVVAEDDRAGEVGGVDERAGGVYVGAAGVGEDTSDV